MHTLTMSQTGRSRIIYTKRQGRRRTMRLCELEDKEVINVADGRALGSVTDVDFDPKCGQIESIIVPGPGRCMGLFGREFELYIPWRCICRIGPDTVLVDIDIEKCKHKG